MSHTSALAAFERVFDTRSMSAALTPTAAAAEAVADARALTQKLSRSLGIPTATTLIDQARPRPVTPSLTDLFARGGLPYGEVVVMSGRSVLSLALACSAMTTQDGGWCAGIGLGEPAVAAMEDLGLDLSHFVCLDTPAQDWMRVTSILLESFDVLVVDPGFSASAGDRARIAAKLRDSRATLILLDSASAAPLPVSSGAPSHRRSGGPSGGTSRSSFPGSSEHLAVRGESWEGTAQGTGRLRRRVLRVHSARTGEHALVLPDPRGAAVPHAPAVPTPAVPTPANSTSADSVPAGTLRLVPDTPTASAGSSGIAGSS